MVTDSSESEVGVYVMLDGKTQQITHQSGIIVSHRKKYYDKNYPNNVESTLIIEKDGILLFDISVIDFELQPGYYDWLSRWTCYDYLEIEGHKYCGGQLTSARGHTYITSTGTLSMNFYTNRWTRDKGFTLKYSYFSKYNV